MTRSQMTRIVRGWQRRLRLQNYALTIAYDSFDLNTPELGAYAQIKVHDDYESARLTLSDRHTSWNERLANEVVVHELLHIFENGPGTAMESLSDVLDDPAYKLFESRYNHEVENMIDRLALIIVALAGVVPQPPARSETRAAD